MLRTLLAGLALCAAATGAAAQDRAAASPTTPAAAVSAAAQAAPDTGRVAVPVPSAKAVRYHRSGNVLWVVRVLWGLLVPAVILFSGLSARLRDAARRIGRNWFFTLALYIAGFTLLVWLVDLPLAFYSGFVRQHAYGLSNQTFGKWIGDALKALAVGLVIAPLVLWVPYWLLRRSPRRWWLYSGLAAIPLLVLLNWAAPLYFDPLFNRFGPMEDKTLEAEILALADRAGIEGGRVFEVDKSVDTKTVNAYVTGFGGSKRIVLWDTLLRALGRREVLFVMGHEMGHYVLRHVLWGLALGAAGTLFSLWAVHRTAGWLIARWRHRFRFDRLEDVASYPLLLLVVSVLGLAGAPFANAFSRSQEHEADRFGLELTRDNRAMALAFVKLQRENLAVPYPSALFKLFRASHPPLGERIEFANAYRPWETGRPLKYGDRFRATAGAGPAASVPEAERYGGTLVIGSTADIGDISPLTWHVQNALYMQEFVLFTPLIAYDRALRPVPRLAERWEVNADTTLLTFHLRRDVYWHDGAKTTAADLKFSYDRARDPSTGFIYSGLWTYYGEAEAPDSFTFRVRMRPHAEYLDVWRVFAPVPRHLLQDVPPAELKRHPFATRAPVGNGPFRFVSRQAGQRWTFEANPRWPRALGGRPYLDRLVYRVIPEPATLLTELETGGIDVIIAQSSEMAERIRASRRARLVEFPDLVYEHIVWNHRRAPFGDARVRRALTLAIDRERLVEGVRGGHGRVANSTVAPMLWMHDSTAGAEVRHDPAAA
ncbi:MAG TPA: ABC transporter substrate-binding protein, partial [Longimicrobiaceae bacterium]|nr:ABC transporter substrate-binding protein [Longimicrobiaceae bacterium]